MKSLIFLTALSIVGSCANKSNKEKIQDIKDGIVVAAPDKALQYGKTITADELELHTTVFSSARFEGRAVGTKGQKLAAEYLEQFYILENIATPLGGEDYFQEVPSSYLSEAYNDSENVIAFIKGSEKPDEVVVISGHYDHEGVSPTGEIFHGADDNGSGTAVMLEIAQAFKAARDNGHGPKRSIAFLHFTAEEIGLYGSKYYTDYPIFPLENTIACLNMDMIGRVDAKHQRENNENYLYLIGSNRLSTELHYLSEAVNAYSVNLDLDYKYNDINDRNKYYYRSDHFNFARYNVPVIFYFSGEHEDYHKPTDTAEKLNYPVLEKRAQLIFGTAWQLANQDKRIEADKAQ